MIFALCAWSIFAAVVSFLVGPLALWPSALLFFGLALAHRFAPRVRFELRGQLGRLWPMLLVVPPSVGLWFSWLEGRNAAVTPVALFVLVLLAAPLHASVVASEFTDRTAPTWLAQPRPLWSLLLEKWALAAGLSTLALAQLLTVCPRDGQLLMLGPAIAAVLGGFSLLSALILKETLAAAFVTLVTCLLPLTVLLGFDTPDDASPTIQGLVTAIPAVASLVTLVLVLRRPRAALLVQVREPRALAFSAGRGSASRALLLKELRLLAPAFGLMGGVVFLWAVGNRDTRVPLTLFGGLMVTVLASISGVLSEKAHGTFFPELAVLPVRLAWRAKILAAAAVAAVGGYALPLALLRVHGASTLDNGLSYLSGPWALVVGFTVALGLASSVAFKDLKSAFAGVLVGGGSLFFALMLLSLAGTWSAQNLVARELPLLVPSVLHGHDSLNALLHSTLVSLPALAATLVLLAWARRGFVGGSLVPRPRVLTLTAVAASPFVAGALEWVRVLAY